MEENETILERVLLLMKYNNKNTLSENLEILQEQTVNIPGINNPQAKSIPNKIGDSPLNQAIWINSQTNTNTKNFRDILYLFSSVVSSMSQESLEKLVNDLADKGYGAMTKNLKGFQKSNPGIANLVVENQLYLTKLSKYKKDTKGMKDPARLGYFEPQKPKYELINSNTLKNINNLGIKIMSAKQIADKMIEIAKPKPNKTEPKPQTPEEVQSYFDANYEKIKSDMNSGEDYMGLKKREGEMFKVAKEKQDEELALKTQLFDFSKLPYNTGEANLIEQGGSCPCQYVSTNSDGVSYYNQRLNKTLVSKKPEVWNWKEPLTGIEINIQCKCEDEILSILVNEYTKRQAYLESEELKKNELLKIIFGEDKFLKSFNEYTTESLVEFYNNVLDGKYTIDGRVVGKYNRDENGNTFLQKWPKNTPIKAMDKNWDKYGIYIQIGGIALVALLTSGLGVAPFASMLINTGADTVLNLASLSYSIKSGDKDLIKMDLSFLLLPFFFSNPTIKSLLKTAKYSSEAINGLEATLKSIPKNASRQVILQTINNLPNNQKVLIQELGKKEYESTLKNVSQEVINALTKDAKLPKLRRFSEPLINVIAYSSPVISTMIKKISNSFKQKTGRSIRKEDEKLWEVALSIFNEEELNKITSAISNSDKETQNKLIDLFERSKNGVETKKAIEDLRISKEGENYKTKEENLIKELIKLDEEMLGIIGLEDEIDIKK